MDKASKDEVRAIFPVLCVVIGLVLFSSMPIYRGLESNFSEEKGLGAAMVLLRDELTQNESVATFLGLPAPDSAVTVGTAADAHSFDLAAEVAAYIEIHTPKFVPPLDGKINSAYGVRVDPFYAGNMLFLDAGDYESHRGIDISAAQSRDICSALDGTVRFVGWDNSYGNYLIISHDDCETLYAHCASILVAQGEAVRAGEQIAVAGMTGRATGVHLHFEVLVDGVSVDPLQYFAWPAKDGSTLT